MAFVVDLKSVVKHIVDGTLAENLCRLCLSPLGDVSENVFTKFCTEDMEFCVADVLEEICNIKIHPSEEYNVCSNCFIAASSAYKFSLLSQQSNNVINFYVQELENHIDQLELIEQDENMSFCITLPSLEVGLPILSFNAENCLNNYRIGLEATFNESKETLNTKMKSQGDEKLILVVKEEAGKPSYYRIKTDGTLKEISQKLLPAPNPDKCSKKITRKRDPMASMQCSKCPVSYRFMAKFKEHMKLEHNVDLYICKICKATFEDVQEYANHQKTHSNTHYCAHCNAVFKKRETMIAHIKAHEDTKNLSKMEGAHVCELCGVILPNEEELKIHHDKKHNKKYTCFYCGRMYRGENSFEMHVKKHEQVMKAAEKSEKDKAKAKEDSQQKLDKKRLICPTCGKDFGDERSLKWHSMLHTNERPYVCDVCGRGFISVNRRNQHAVCAHTAPSRRCPLCPALFHLRSMVNTHIKKVHLREHKRRSRTSKHQSAVWRNEAVPIQELSVSIQSAILDLKSKQEEKI